ncbi:zinc-binding protein A33-like [Protopterus annectens]|uniref:zinc-binding protein A33-like n=1 Tax=Protopterus annectens TaxID=7888 RepID=UPI001CFBD372|nr:zinc-binding protein A33-like [Protopterus annectens]
MAAGNPLHDLAEDLLCSVCLYLFKEAVVLECGHSFCKSCIDKVWDSENITFCPECRKAFPSKSCPVCVICMISSKHKGYRLLPILEAASMFQDNLKNTVSSLEMKMKHLKECQSKQEQIISGIKDDVQSLEQHITSEFAKLRQFLQDKEQQMIQQLKEKAAGILEKMT